MAVKDFIIKHFGGLPSINSWKWLLRVNPNSSNSFPLAKEYRKTAPGSQPLPNLETPPQLSKSRYYERDMRRNYPKTVIYTGADFDKLPATDYKIPNENKRYKYIRTDSYDPTGSAANPHFSIRMVK